MIAKNDNENPSTKPLTDCFEKNDNTGTQPKGQKRKGRTKNKKQKHCIPVKAKENNGKTGIKCCWK